MRFEDVDAAVSPEEGQAAACTKCQAVEGEPCRYVAGRWVNSRYALTNAGAQPNGRAFQIRPGAPMTGMVHPERKAVIRARRLELYRAEQRAERARLAAWWREHGHIFTSLTEAS